MDWSRLGGAVSDGLLFAFVLGSVMSPPDPFTQLLYAGPAVAVAVPVLYRYRDPAGRWWARYAVFLAGVLGVALAWRLVAFAVGASATGVPAAASVVGVALGAWLAFFGGAGRAREVVA
ncbi:DUF7534 family protein [Halorussus halobius]|uniref:DUF7534 family protein n=1 Tax=Halorussus halobius TaxID=1710537 RepID=UPI00109254DF|nr:hypothetical protein [Halorussus halobius]